MAEKIRKMGLPCMSKNIKHNIGWKTATVSKSESHYWKRGAVEALCIQIRPQTTNLDCGLKLNDAQFYTLHLRGNPIYTCT